MKVGDTKQVAASAVPTNASDAAEVVAAVKWSSSDDTVATVSSDGTISAKAEGTATITATSGSFTAAVAVSVSVA